MSVVLKQYRLKGSDTRTLKPESKVSTASGRPLNNQKGSPTDTSGINKPPEGTGASSTPAAKA